MSTMAMEAPVRTNLSWSTVVLILGGVFILMSSTVLLVLLHADVANVLNAVMAVVVLILSYIGYDAKRQLETKMDNVQGGVQTVKEISNGRLTEVMNQNQHLQDQIQELQRQNTALALQVPTPILPDPSSVSPAQAPTPPAAA